METIQTDKLIQNDQTLTLDEIIQLYLITEVPDGKATLCRFYKRGCCFFTAAQCKYAHGANDLQLKEGWLEELTKASVRSAETESEEIEKNKKEVEDDEGGDHYIEKATGQQPAVKLGTPSYKNLYEFQTVLKERGEIKELASQGDIDNDGVLRRKIRRRWNENLQEEFFDFLLKEFNTNALKKHVYEKFLYQVGWMPHWRYLTNYVYEVKSSTLGHVVTKQLQGEAFDNFMEDCVIRIFKENDLIDKLPVSPSMVTKYYYSYLSQIIPLLPAHHVYLRYRNFKTIDDYLDTLQNSEKFKRRLAEECGKSYEDIFDEIIFAHSTKEMQAVLNQIKVILLEMIEKSHIGFILYKRYEEQVMQTCQKKLQQFGTNIPQIKKIIAKIALQENVLLVNLNSDIYLFSLPKFKKANVSEIKNKYTQKLFSGCTLSPSDHLENHIPYEVTEEKVKTLKIEPKSDEFLNEEIDLKKVVVVDTLETLELAKDHFANVEAMGVDLEGSLRKGGRLELIQCSSREKIFIFDIYKTKKMAKENKDDASVYQSISNYLKNIIEDSRICKIFHDGRMDSLALHVFLDACPSNVFDLSAVYMLIEHLERYKAQLVKAENKEEEEKKEEKVNKNFSFKAGEFSHLVGEVKLPGLNEVLSKYKASHGINRLKYVMKERFGSVPIEYFLKRPIDKEFLVYSAKDVEDLIEVKENMEKVLREIVNCFINGIEDERVDLLCKKVSKTYALHGCHHIENTE